MKQRPRIYYTEEQKAMMWDRWQKGDQTIKPGKSPDRRLTANNSSSKSNAIIVVCPLLIIY